MRTLWRVDMNAESTVPSNTTSAEVPKFDPLTVTVRPAVLPLDGDSDEMTGAAQADAEHTSA